MEEVNKEEKMASKRRGRPPGSKRQRMDAPAAAGVAMYEQQPDESAKSYAAFRAYLDMGPERSLAGLDKKLGRGKGSVEYLSRRFGWQARVRAHDAHLAVAEREATAVQVRAKAGEWLRRQEEVREREWAMHEKCLRAAERALDAFLERQKIRVSLTDIARIVEVASKMGRLASGLATEKAEITGQDGGPIRLQLEAALDKIYGKPIPGEVVDVEETEEQEAESRKESQGLVERGATNGEALLTSCSAEGEA